MMGMWCRRSFGHAQVRRSRLGGVSRVMGRASVLPALVLLTAFVVMHATMLYAEVDGKALPADPLAGRQVFLQKGCQTCHAVWGEGGSLGPDLGKGGVWHSVMQLAGVLWNHSPEMIEKMRERRMSRPVISSKEMADLAAFLYFLNYFDAPGDSVRGKLLFADKGCSKCHAVGGGGASVGPALDKYKQLASPLFLARAMWSRGPAMAKKMAELRVARPELRGADLADILAYIQSASTDGSTEKVYMVPGSPARGETVFAEKGCVKCHAVRGVGGHVGPDLGTSGLHKSVTEIAGLMWDHEPAMWARMQESGIALPAFSDQEISDVIAYLFFLQYFDPKGEVSKGREVYIEKGCVLCHYTPRGADKRLAPDLSASAALGSPIELSSAMWNHAPAMEAQIRERGLPWPRFQDDDVRDLVEYLRSSGGSPP
jgi:mono/diheme cytochrome c family protein